MKNPRPVQAVVWSHEKGCAEVCEGVVYDPGENGEGQMSDRPSNRVDYWSGPADRLEAEGETAAAGVAGNCAQSLERVASEIAAERERRLEAELAAAQLREALAAIEALPERWKEEADNFEANSIALDPVLPPTKYPSALGALVRRQDAETLRNLLIETEASKAGAKGRRLWHRDQLAETLRASHRGPIVEADEWRPLADHVLELLSDRPASWLLAQLEAEMLRSVLASIAEDCRSGWSDPAGQTDAVALEAAKAMAQAALSAPPPSLDPLRELVRDHGDLLSGVTEVYLQGSTVGEIRQRHAALLAAYPFLIEAEGEVKRG